MTQGFIQENTFDEVFDYPNRVTIFHENSKVTAGNSLSRETQINYRYTIAAFQETPADGDTFEVTFPLRAGTYTFSTLGKLDSDQGTIDWYMDGVVFESGQDWYQASLNYAGLKTASVTISEDGYHTLKGVVNGKNASSTDYYIRLTKYWLKQSSD